MCYLHIGEFSIQKVFLVSILIISNLASVGYFNMIQKEGQIIHLISLRIRYTLNTMLEKGFGPPGRGWVMIHILSFLIGWSQVRG